MEGSTVKVLAVDPGLKTGVCLYDADKQQIELALIIPDGLLGFRDWWEYHCQNIDGDMTVICETFEAEEGTHGIDYTPIEIIGYLKAINAVDVWQRRMQRGKNSVASVAVLKRAGLYPRRGELKEGHQVAALMHALTYLMKIRHLPTIELLHPREVD